MNKDLIETPRFNFFIGDEVFLKGKIVGFDVDENKCVENVVRLGYGETLNVPNNDIYITDDIVDKSKIKVTIPQSVADWIRKCKTFKSFAVSLSFALQPSVWEVNGLSDESIEWLANAENQEIFARAWLDDYDIQIPGVFLTVGESIQLKMLFYKRLRNFTTDRFLTFRESDWNLFISDLVNEFVR
ncbi:Protein of uncharacterised function (DUF1642) [Streptococcus pneumoniae]|nr:Protein of uncharacterised function (DUF1642) [Streptococcus pneumoniae]